VRRFGGKSAMPVLAEKSAEMAKPMEKKVLALRQMEKPRTFTR